MLKIKLNLLFVITLLSFSEIHANQCLDEVSSVLKHYKFGDFNNITAHGLFKQTYNHKAAQTPLNELNLIKPEHQNTPALSDAKVEAFYLANKSKLDQLNSLRLQLAVEQKQSRLHVYLKIKDIDSLRDTNEYQQNKKDYELLQYKTKVTEQKKNFLELEIYYSVRKNGIELSCPVNLEDKCIFKSLSTMFYQMAKIDADHGASCLHKLGNPVLNQAEKETSVISIQYTESDKTSFKKLANDKLLEMAKLEIQHSLLADFSKINSADETLIYQKSENIFIKESKRKIYEEAVAKHPEYFKLAKEADTLLTKSYFKVCAMTVNGEITRYDLSPLSPEIVPTLITENSGIRCGLNGVSPGKPPKPLIKKSTTR